MSEEKRYQTMVFTKTSYSWNKTEEEARADMWKDIATFMQLLIKNDNICVVYDDDVDIIVIQYEHNEKNDPYGVANPEWVTEEELWKIQSLEDELTEEKEDDF